MTAAGRTIEVRVDFVSEDQIIAVTYTSENGAVYHGILLPGARRDGVVGVDGVQFDQWKKAQAELIGLSCGAAVSSPSISASETSSLSLRQTYFQHSSAPSNNKPTSRRKPNGILSRSVRVVRLRPSQGLCTKCCVPLHSGHNSADFHYPGLGKKRIRKPKEERKFLSPVRAQPHFTSQSFTPPVSSPEYNRSLPPRLLPPVSLPVQKVMNVVPLPVKSAALEAPSPTNGPAATSDPGGGSPAIPKLKISFGTKRKKTLTIVGGSDVSTTTKVTCDEQVAATSSPPVDIVGQLENFAHNPAGKRSLSRSSSIDSLEELKPLVIDYEDPEEETTSAGPSVSLVANEPSMPPTQTCSLPKKLKDPNIRTQKTAPVEYVIRPPHILSEGPTGSGDLPKTETFPANPHNVKPKEIVWAKMSTCPWWPAEIYALYPMEVSPVQQSVCVIWIDAANEHGFLDVRSQVEPFLSFFKKRYNRKRNSVGYQVSIGQALKRTKELMGSDAFLAYEQDIVGLVSSECLKAMGYEPPATRQLSVSPGRIVPAARKPQENPRLKRKRMKKAVIVPPEPVLFAVDPIVTDVAELDSFDSEQPSCSSVGAESSRVDLNDFLSNDVDDSPQESSADASAATAGDHNQSVTSPIHLQSSSSGDDYNLFDSVLTQLQQINQLCDGDSSSGAKASQSLKLSCT